MMQVLDVRPLRGVEVSIFRADGSRVVRGDLGTVTYDAEGNAEFVLDFALPALRDTDHLRVDLNYCEAHDG